MKSRQAQVSISVTPSVLSNMWFTGSNDNLVHESLLKSDTNIPCCEDLCTNYPSEGPAMASKKWDIKKKKNTFVVTLGSEITQLLL